MDSPVNGRCHSETEAHRRLKRLSLVWAQVNGYSMCAVEVTLPRCRYRADVAAYRRSRQQSGMSAIFECKQTLVDLRRDNGCSKSARARLEALYRRRQTLEKHLRVHYPALRIPDSLFAEFDSHNFSAIAHRGYVRVLREQSTLQNRLYNCRKFETLIRYRCANLFFLVLPNDLFREPEIPAGWGALVEENGKLKLAHKPTWHEVPVERRLQFIERIAAAGTREFNRQWKINFDDLLAARSQSFV